MRSPNVRWLVLLVGSLASCGSDSDDEDSSTDAAVRDASADARDAAVSAPDAAVDVEGKKLCCVLGLVCHDVDDGLGALGECHDLGHRGEPNACREGYDRCMALCLDAGATGMEAAECE